MLVFAKIILLILHVFACIFLIIVVLLQAGKEGLGGLLGVPGGSAENVHFHSKLNKVTTYCAIGFLCTTIALGMMYSYGNKSSLAKKIKRKIAEKNVKKPKKVEVKKEVNSQINKSKSQKNAEKVSNVEVKSSENTEKKSEKTISEDKKSVEKRTNIKLKEKNTSQK